MTGWATIVASKFYIIEFIDGDTRGIACDYYIAREGIYAFHNEDHSTITNIPYSAIKTFTPVDEATFKRQIEAYWDEEELDEEEEDV